MGRFCLGAWREIEGICGVFGLVWLGLVFFFSSSLSSAVTCRVVTACCVRGLTGEAEEEQSGCAMTCAFPHTAAAEQRVAGSGPDVTIQCWQVAGGHPGWSCSHAAPRPAPVPWPSDMWLGGATACKNLNRNCWFSFTGKKSVFLMPCSQMHYIIIFNSSDHMWAGKYIITYIKYIGVSLLSLS